MHELFGNIPVFGRLIATSAFFFLFTINFLTTFYFTIKEKFVGYTLGSDPYRALLKDDTKIPELYFYSKKDHLVPYKDVECFANYREKLGNKITKVCFEDSLHIKHFMAHPEVYKKLH